MTCGLLLKGWNYFVDNRRNHSPRGGVGVDDYWLGIVSAFDESPCKGTRDRLVADVLARNMLSPRIRGLFVLLGGGGVDDPLRRYQLGTVGALV